MSGYDGLQDAVYSNSEPCPTTGCWLWTGFVHSGGYGQVKCKGVLYSAHRASYEAFVGKIQEGQVVCHRCDTKLCVNPEHLWVGTQSENMADMVNKGRSLSGERHNMSKLREVDVEEILDLFFDRGLAKEKIGRLFGVSGVHVGRICAGKAWASVFKRKQGDG